MSTPNQKSIISFFHALKHHWPPESEATDNRPSKFARVSTPTLSDIELDNHEINKDTDNDDEIEVLSISNKDSSPQPTGATILQKLNS